MIKIASAERARGQRPRPISLLICLSHGSLLSCPTGGTLRQRREKTVATIKVPQALLEGSIHVWNEIKILMWSANLEKQLRHKYTSQVDFIYRWELARVRLSKRALQRRQRVSRGVLMHKPHSRRTPPPHPFSPPTCFSSSPSYLMQLRACWPDGRGFSSKWAVNPSSPPLGG